MPPNVLGGRTGNDAHRRSSVLPHGHLCIGVYMSTIYGEGTHSFVRLQEEIMIKMSSRKKVHVKHLRKGFHDRPQMMSLYGLFALSRNVTSCPRLYS